MRAMGRNERGFTLPELLVVIVVLGILLAVAIPSFLRSRQRGQNSAAQATVKSALAAERTYYVDYQTYTTDANALRAIEPNVLWTTTDARQSGAMVATGGSPAGSVVVLSSWSVSGLQYCVMNIATDQSAAVNGQTQAGTYYLSTTTTVTTPPTSVTLSQCGTTGYSRDPAVWN